MHPRIAESLSDECHCVFWKSSALGVFYIHAQWSGNESTAKRKEMIEGVMERLDTMRRYWTHECVLEIASNGHTMCVESKPIGWELCRSGSFRDNGNLLNRRGLRAEEAKIQKAKEAQYKQRTFCLERYQLAQGKKASNNFQIRTNERVSGQILRYYWAYQYSCNWAMHYCVWLDENWNSPYSEQSLH